MSTIVDLMGATVKLEQPIGGGQAVTGTGFVVAASADDGTPRLILVTAGHVLARMSRDKVQVGFRDWSPEYGWRYAPVNVRIRNADGAPLWTKHPTQDVSTLELPASVSSTAVPISELPGEQALKTLRVQPGDEMMVLGFPRGIASTEAGFPILRSGKVASYPLSPADRYPTYLVDFDVYGGNSGGPVYIPVRNAQAGSPSTVVIAGVLTQQIMYQEQRLAIGNVTQADYISETVSLMEGIEAVEVSAAPDAVANAVAEPSPASSTPRSSQDRLQEAWKDFEEGVSILIRRTWIVVRDWFKSIVTPDARRV
jgi:hypothetical protein